MQHYALASVKDNSPLLAPSDVHHATRVMRMKAGDRFVAIWQNGRHLCQIKSVTPFCAEFTGQKLASNEPRAKVTVLLSLIKPAHLELAVQKCTEAGASSVCFVLSARSQRTPVNIQRLQRIAKEAAEQAHRDLVPTVSAPLPMEKAISLASGQKYVLDLQAGVGLMEGRSAGDASYCVAVGPEGGWDASELELMKNAGFACCSLGKTVLRAETAAIVAVHALCWFV